MLHAFYDVYNCKKALYVVINKIISSSFPNDRNFNC